MKELLIIPAQYHVTGISIFDVELVALFKKASHLCENNLITRQTKKGSLWIVYHSTILQK